MSKTRDLWEIEGESTDGSRGPFIEVARGKTMPLILREDFEPWDPSKVTKLHLYHSYPSPGPQRRYCGWYDRATGVFTDCRRG